MPKPNEPPKVDPLRVPCPLPSCAAGVDVPCRNLGTPGAGHAVRHEAPHHAHARRFKAAALFEAAVFEQPKRR